MSLFGSGHEKRDELHLAERVAALESQRDNLAPRTWVQEVLRPLEQSITRMEQSVSRLADESKILFSFHEELLKERAEHERLKNAAEIEAIKESHQLAMEAASKAAVKAEEAASKAAERAEERAEQSHPIHLLQTKVTPILGFITAAAGVLAVVGGSIGWWIVHYVLPQVPR